MVTLDDTASGKTKFTWQFSRSSWLGNYQMIVNLHFWGPALISQQSTWGPAESTVLRWFNRIFIHHQEIHKPGVRRKLYLLEWAGSGQTTCNHFFDGWDFPPWQTAHLVILLNVLIILNCLFCHCLSKWRERGCQEHIPLVIQTACLASKSVYFFLSLNRNLFFCCNIC